jgi:hypothetical protein
MSLKPTANSKDSRAPDSTMAGTGPTGRSVAGRPSQRVVARSCRHCGASFEAVRHQTFCRASCRWEFFKAKRARRENPAVDSFRQPFE